ncbi:XRE family transcriptional regulator [Novosphingobium sp.]|uniref:ImmA/IrrE family metallo-endopeptidase n=1 Tax=Novosphingobium sp. TaxID=1874826 RepID=UPI0025EECF39|nr:XRE family transcriptional regulator [Novosphingobium sp.]
MARFNHHLLTLARDSRGVTQAELADIIGMGQGTLSKYETGVLDAPDEFADDAGSALNYPASFFFQAGRPFGFPPFHFRKRKKLSAKALGKIVAEMNIRRMHVEKLSVSFQLSTNRFIPEIDRDEFQGRTLGVATISDLARSLRESWMLPSGPIENVVDLIEGNGGIVIPCDFGTDLLDAMSQRIDGLPVLFFVNTNSSMDRLRFTLCHELAHMVLHTTEFKEDGEMEKEADEFAGSFLLPPAELRSQLRRFDLPHLANMKAYWKVSMSSIAMNAHRHKLITDYQRKMFFIEMNRLGYAKREPNEPPREQPKILRRMIEFHRTKLEYSDSDIANLLCVTPEDFKRVYQPDPTSTRHLRLVN